MLTELKSALPGPSRGLQQVHHNLDLIQARFKTVRKTLQSLYG